MAGCVCHGLLSSSGCEKGPGVEPLKPGVLSRVNPLSFCHRYHALQEDQPPAPDPTPRGRVGACMCPAGASGCQCPAAMPVALQPAALPVTPVLLPAPRPPTLQVGGPETVPRCSVGTSQGETSECCLQRCGAAWARLHPGLLPQTPPHLVLAGGTVHVVCLCALVSSLCRRQALCRQTVQLESRFMEPGLWGGTWEEQVGVRENQEAPEKQRHGVAGREMEPAACDRVVGPRVPMGPRSVRLS